MEDQEMSCKCVHRMMGVNLEAALEINRQETVGVERENTGDDS